MLQLKQSLTASFCYIFPEDSAVDRDHADFSAEKYEETGDEKYLPLKAGETVTKFHCRPLSREAFTVSSGLMMQGNANEGAMAAVAYGLRSIAGLRDPIVCETDRSGRLTAKTLDALYETLGYSVLARLGATILARSSVSPF